jgi:hypothetical protein
VAGRFHASHRRHVEIHHDDVRREFADVHDRLGTRRGLPDDLELLLFEQVPQPRPEQVVIVYQQHTERFRLPFLGRFHQLRHREFPLSRRSV